MVRVRVCDWVCVSVKVRVEVRAGARVRAGLPLSFRIEEQR